MLNSNQRSPRYVVAAVAALAFVLCGAPASAANWTESTDTGDLPGTAQVTTGPAGEPLNTINGTIDETRDRDLHQILIPDPGAFSTRRITASLCAFRVPAA
jgi:hypothetical protein